MNRNLCVLSTSKGIPHLMAGGFKDGRLMVAISKKINPVVDEESKKTISSLDQEVVNILARYHQRGFAVYVDETIVRFSKNYQHSSLIDSANPIIGTAYNCYQDLNNAKQIVYKDGGAISLSSTFDIFLDETGKQAIRVNGDELTSEKSALLLMSYHALNSDLTDINFLKEMNNHRKKARLKSQMLRVRR